MNENLTNSVASDGRRTEKGSLKTYKRRFKMLNEGLTTELKTITFIEEMDKRISIFF